MDADRRMHLAWFLGDGFGVHDWNSPWRGTAATEWMTGEFYVDFIRALERARFDYLIIEDSAYVPDGYEKSTRYYLQNARSVPKHDPAVLATLMLGATRHIGVVPTLAVTEYQPYLLARLVSTLDNVSGGRAGWNIVTGSSDRAAQNYGKPTQPAHDLRYEIAQEMTDAVRALWSSWDADSIVAELESGIFADHQKVRPVDFEGRFFRTRGPLNTAPPPQGRPALIQAGGSPAGRAFAARNADSIIAAATSVEEMKEYRDDVRSRAEAAGRDPDEVKVLFLCTPFLGETRAEAVDRKKRHDDELWARPEIGLAGLGFITDIDFSPYDVDTPLAELATSFTTNGHQSSLAARLGDPCRTLREVATQPHAIEPVGTPEEVAAELGAMIGAVGGDGVLFYVGPLNRRVVAEITDGLVPELQRQGLSRLSYDSPFLRGNLTTF
ncbi:NtaA/DmoA family FMN-dependent monooxygenase [Mycolicibacterium vinylchloridicum]|uniref:NtaA/DmoA family FMN-dependent monooxygenase n=1 Tax=Mycolicibacterium vinylchloridicum TaxID=2736928 RepID=UPI002D7E5A10|nr:NtaA/DmoA family FMN-dependent monooxygenase [Mycolicibacterium vinylchloridicum]